MAAALCVAKPTGADGGRVEISRETDQHRVTVFRSPVPAQVGRVDISVMIQDLRSGDVLPETPVRVKCTHLESGKSIVRPANSEQATNKLLASAKIDLPTAGTWQVEVAVDAPVSTRLSFPVFAQQATVNVTVLTWIAGFPVLFCIAFALREMIRNPKRNGPGNPSDRSDTPQ